MKRTFKTLGFLMLAVLGYLLFWPVPIDPVAWKAPTNAGYVGDFAPNEKLAGLDRVDIGDHKGPEDLALGPDGNFYVPTHDGAILRLDPGTGETEEFAKTNGRVLGVAFGRDGILYAADAYDGLYAIDPSGNATLLTDKVDDGSPIPYADGVDVTSDGQVYFSDASAKFGAKAYGGTLPASLLDLLEHGPNGRVMKFDTKTGATTKILDGLSFANGVALTKDEKHLLIVETGTYSIWKMPLDDPEAATQIITNLPGFPDNIKRDPDGTFWLGLVSPRSEPVDKLSELPFIRKIIQRLPSAIQPKPQRYGCLVRIDENGKVLETLQDASGNYALITGALTGPDGKLYVSSLTEPDLAILERE